MKTKDFIRDNLNYKPLKPQMCSSVLQATDGNFYSYGAHYPLLIKVKDVWLVNTEGYSSTTGRHIHWAKDFAQASIDLGFARPLDSDVSLKAVKLALRKEQSTLLKDLSALTPRAYKKKETILRRLEEVKKLLTAFSNGQNTTGKN